MQFKMVSFLCVASGLALSGCDLSSIMSKPMEIAVDQFIKAVNSNRERFGVSDKITLTKKSTQRDGWIVVYDPRVGGRHFNENGEWVEYPSHRYFAVNFKSLIRDNPLGFAGLYDDRKDDGDYGCKIYCVGVTPTGDNTFKGVDGNLYEQTQTSDKDLEAVQAAVDAINERRLGIGLAAHFGLSDEQGLRLSKAVAEWETLSRSRQMTERDVGALSSDLFGIDISAIKKAQTALVNGDQSLANDLINKAANSIDTTPENLRRILETISQ
jgi:hypothetical protein